MPTRRWIALCGALLLAASPQPAAAQSANFGRDDYASFAGARGIVVGDFDRNGWPDIAQANTTRNTITILLNHDGTLTKGSDVPVDRGPFAISSGDFNGDGIADLVITIADANSIALLIGQAEGRFAMPARFALADIRSPRGVAVADVNRDGNADLLVTGYDSNALTVLLGDGRNGFTRGASWFGPYIRPQGVVVADFNRDGRADVVVAGDGAAGLVVQYGNGSPNVFAPGTVLPGAHDLNVVSGGDVNGDGWPDVIAVSTRNSQVAVFLGGPSGLSLSRSYATGSSPRDVTLADVNMDGMSDVITADYSSSTVSVLLGKNSAPGTYDAARHFASNSGSRAVAAADFNLDGRLDLATGNQNAAFTTVLTNSTILPTTGFSFHTTLLGTPSPATGSNAVIAADFNRDGKLDLGIRAPYPTVGISILLADGPTVNLTTSAQFPPAQFFDTDANGDGNPDVLIVNCAPGLDLFTELGDGRGGFTPSPHTTVSNDGCSVAPGNFNGDAYPDLAIVAYDRSAASYVLRTMFGNGNGTFRPGPSRLLDATSHTMAGVGDLNRDGRVDAVLAKNGVGLEIWFGNGGGAFTSSVVLPLRSGPPSVQIADLNHDGYLDIVGGTFEISVVLNGPAGFGAATYFNALPTSTASLAVADMNLDGNLDIVTEQGELFAGFGDGTFGAASLFDVGLQFSGVRIADYNHDGLPDVLAGGSHGAVRLLINERNSVNHPPIADAGADRTVAYQDQFNDANGFFIGGLGGSDPDSHALRFEWRDSTGAIISTFRGAGILAKSPGRYTFQLTVFDDRGGSGTDSVTITIAPTKEVVLYAAADTQLVGSLWTTVADASAAGGRRLYNPNAGAPKVTTPAANPASFVEIPFVADPTQGYKLWIRLKADGNNFANDSVWVQFRGSTTAEGVAAYRVGTNSGLEVNLEECLGCGLAGWGWEDDGWGSVNRNGTTVRFPDGGLQFIRIQRREDGVSIDQIVLSSEKYLTARPGSAKNDQTILLRTFVLLPPD